jgi:hypothetical protein
VCEDGLPITFAADKRGLTTVEVLILCLLLLGALIFGAAGLRSADEAQFERLVDYVLGRGTATSPGSEPNPNYADVDQRPRANPSFSDVPYIRPPFQNGDFRVDYERYNGAPFVEGLDDDRAIHPNDMSQGALQDCFLVDGLAETANVAPDLIRQAIRPNGDGTYTLTFRDPIAPANRPSFWSFTQPGSWSDWWNGWWNGYTTREVIVTPEFPSANGRPVFAGLGDAPPGDRNATEIWPALLEKGYVQAYFDNDYNKVVGTPGEVMARLSGIQSTRMLPDGPGQPLFTLNAPFEEMAANLQRGFGYTAYTPAIQDNNGRRLPQADLPLFKNNRLIDHHGYYVTDVNTRNGTVTLRNPWGWGRGETVITFDEFRSHFYGLEWNPMTPSNVRK